VDTTGGISGVRVQLIGPGPDGQLGTADDVVVAETVNSGDGYRFDDISPGAYTIRIDPARLPAGARPVFDPDGTNDLETMLTMAQGQTVSDLDFGFQADFDLATTKEMASVEGRLVTWTIDVTNVGAATAPGPIVLADSIPAGMRVVSVEPDTGLRCVASGTALTCDWQGDLSPGASVGVALGTEVERNGTFENSAEARSLSGSTEPNLVNNSDSASATVQVSTPLPFTGLDAISMTVVGAAPLVAGTLLLRRRLPQQR